jgi:hypothetical protein
MTTQLILTDEQVLALHDGMRRIGVGMCMARQKRKHDGRVPAPDSVENAVHEVVRQLAIPAAAVRAKENEL